MLVYLKIQKRNTEKVGNFSKDSNLSKKQQFTLNP
jgi:hypothetical protein